MSRALVFFTLLLAFSRADALYGHALARCQFSSPDGHDAVYLEQYYFNKRLVGLYNGTLGKIIGYTKETIKMADTFNNNPAFAHLWKPKTERCRRISPLAYNALLKSVEPSVWLRSVEAVDSRHPGMLVCSAYDFYPQQIRLTWLRNGQVETSDVMYTDELPNGNWLYQIHSYLEFTPRPGEKITCMVEHASLMEPKLYDWEPTADSGINKIVVGTAGLLLGLVFSVAGLIYYKKKSSERVLVPTTEVFYPELTL
ncbi:H-2 class II histocompatibility antigen, E-S beta chain-like [Morone saxatilis]|uniref:H-2 class II histocompatibility antigen, E-S beta chain-like n=1 Tax=Morone saxatilis TaxID=34816 RepID=UPI0015E1CEDC|nr:H-2 class II histocompatibility antigen, E-S beta chain-like [Morone saxatilis]